MQLGFIAYEVGLAREHHTVGVALKNVLDWAVTTLVFGLVGVALMLGDTNGLFGTTGFGLGVDGLDNRTGLSTELVILFQLGFAGTAVTIVSGALAERVTILTYAWVSVVGAGLIYPVVAHWVWGGLLNGQPGWLGALGFHDFAGASVVHVVGGTVALVGALFVGPRVGRFDAEGNLVEMKSSSLAMSAFGVVVLWVGWWGFNGGSAVVSGDVTVGHVILVTNIAGAGGVVTALLISYRSTDVIDPPAAAMGGALSGLVAVTAVADVISTVGALAIGCGAAVVFVAATRVMVKLRIDDALLAVPIHGAAGVYGVLVGPLLAAPGLLSRSGVDQLGVQALGLAAIIAWTLVTSAVFFYLLRRFTGLRIAPSRELSGTEGWREQPPGKPPQDPGRFEGLL